MSGTDTNLMLKLSGALKRYARALYKNNRLGGHERDRSKVHLLKLKNI